MKKKGKEWVIAVSVTKGGSSKRRFDTKKQALKHKQYLKSKRVYARLYSRKNTL